MEGTLEALKAIENEKQGLLANGTWDESNIRPKSEILLASKVLKRFLWLSHLATRFT